jgi:hypothetical protein
VILRERAVSARRGHLDVAVRYLEESVRGGHVRGDELSREADLAALRDDPRFRELLRRYVGPPQSAPRRSAMAE